MPISRDNPDALTGLRFVAAFTIVLGHTCHSWGEVTGIGMPLFFTLSGFIIHYVYAESFDGPWRRAAGAFAVARFSRIFPLYSLLLSGFLLFSSMGRTLATAANVPVLLAYLAGTWAWFPFQLDGHLLQQGKYAISWSVSTELFFYFAYAAGLYRLAGLRGTRQCAVLLIGFCCATYALFYVAFMTRDGWEGAILRHFPRFVSRTQDFNDSFYRWLLYVSPYARIFEFIGGVLTCQLFRLLRQASNRRARLPAAAMAWVACGGMAILFGLFCDFAASSPWLAAGNRSLSAFLVNLHMNFLLAPACYLLILALALGGTAASRALSSWPALRLGEVSYSTYLFQIFAERVLTLTGLALTATAAHLLGIMAVVYAGSFALYWTVEVPAKRWLRHALTPSRFAALPSSAG
jgi:peptidoglycan/LPS O-acetylase OafA/YrhL